MKWNRFFQLLTLWTLPLSLSAAEPEPRDPFDRLDGVGPSRMNVLVIDWAGNIELQISPLGQVRSLGFRIDRETDKNRPVLVVEYQWKHVPYRQIRRALLTTPLKEGFKIYHDRSYEDRDRYILTNHVLTQKGVTPVQPGPAPTQLWPDHHENLKKPAPEDASAPQAQRSLGDGFQPFSTEPPPRRKTPARDVGAQSPLTYDIQKPPAEGVRLQPHEFRQDASGTSRKRDPVEFEPVETEDVRQGFDF